MKLEVTIDGRTFEVDLVDPSPGAEARVVVDGEERVAAVESASPDEVIVRVDGRRFRFAVEPHPGGEQAADGTPVRLLHRNRCFDVRVASEIDRLRARAPGRTTASGPVTIHSALPGVVRQIFLEPGSDVDEGAPILTLEAMKMENEIRAEIAGRIESIHVQPGQVVAAREPLATIVPG